MELTVTGMAVRAPDCDGGGAEGDPSVTLPAFRTWQGRRAKGRRGWMVIHLFIGSFADWFNDWLMHSEMGWLMHSGMGWLIGRYHGLFVAFDNSLNYWLMHSLIHSFCFVGWLVGGWVGWWVGRWVGGLVGGQVVDRWVGGWAHCFIAALSQPQASPEQGTFWGNCERDFSEFEKFYHLPSVSIKAAVFHLLQENKRDGFLRTQVGASMTCACALRWELA